MQRILFIINPNSGTTRQKKSIESISRSILPASEFSIDFAYTQYAGHATELCKQACSSHDIIIAVGGDGTIHEVAQHIIGSDKIMGIVPMGSGNGLARFLGIPLSMKKAIQLIATNQFKRIDTIRCNSEFFLNVAGIGFDANIGNVFNKVASSRGGFHYVKLVTKELFSYQPPTYTFRANNTTFSRTFFIASIANSSQYGLNAHIAPTALINDGKFELVFISKFPAYRSIQLAIKLFTKKIHTSKYVETMQLDNLTIHNPTTCMIHLDGEGREIEGDINFSMHHKSLSIISSN